MRYILCSYTPVCTSPAGRAAAAHYHIPPFADASCRREPDFEHDYPSISSTCRGDKLVNRLQTGDVVVYITKKGRYPGMSAPGWRLAAALKVIQVCGSHRQGAAWYRQRGLRLPYNCIHRRPLPEAQTARIYPHLWLAPMPRLPLNSDALRGAYCPVAPLYHHRMAVPGTEQPAAHYRCHDDAGL